MVSVSPSDRRLTLKFTKTTAQRDAFKPLAGQTFGPANDFWSSTQKEAEVIHFKRLKLSGLATIGDEDFPFEAMLDVRARLLSISTSPGAPVTASRVGATIVDAMRPFMAVPVSRLVVPVENGQTGQRSEWIVNDSDHVSGLLHRLSEISMVETAERIRSRPLKAALKPLLEGMVTNFRAMVTFEEKRTSARAPADYVEFDHTPWELHGARLVELSDEHTLNQDIARFYSYVATYAEAVETIRRNPKSAPDYSLPSNLAAAQAALLTIRAVHHPATQLALTTIRDHGDEEQRKTLGWTDAKAPTVSARG